MKNSLNDKFLLTNRYKIIHAWECSWLLAWLYDNIVIPMTYYSFFLPISIIHHANCQWNINRTNAHMIAYYNHSYYRWATDNKLSLFCAITNTCAFKYLSHEAFIWPTMENDDESSKMNHQKNWRNSKQ
jgi:hypothetical protein